MERGFHSDRTKRGAQYTASVLLVAARVRSRWMTIPLVRRAGQSQAVGSVREDSGGFRTAHGRRLRFSRPSARRTCPPELIPTLRRPVAADGPL